MIRVCLGTLFAMVLSTAASQSARVPAPDPSQGDGGVSSFYTWNDGDIPSIPGQTLRTEPLDPALGLAMAREQLRILYTSTDGIDGKTPAVVSRGVLRAEGQRAGRRLATGRLGAWHHRYC